MNKPDVYDERIRELYINNNMAIKEHAALHMKERQNKRRNDLSTT